MLLPRKNLSQTHKPIKFKSNEDDKRKMLQFHRLGSNLGLNVVFVSLDSRSPSGRTLEPWSGQALFPWFLPIVSPTLWQRIERSWPVHPPSNPQRQPDSHRSERRPGICRVPHLETEKQ